MSDYVKQKVKCPDCGKRYEIVRRNLASKVKVCDLCASARDRASYKAKLNQR
jgi:ribosomal protein L37AE/L43A